MEFFEYFGVSLNLFRGAMGAQGDILFYPWFVRNVNFNGRRDISHIAFFKSVKCKDGVFEPIKFIGNEVFRFKGILVMGLVQ